MRGLLLFLCLMISVASRADLVIEEAVIRMLPPGVPNTAAYFKITNTGDKSRHLIAASSNIADRVELHTHVMRNEVMKMEHLSSVTIPAGDTVQFAPGGLHLMIFGLHSALKPEQQVKLSLKTQDGHRLDFTATARKPGKHHHQH